MNTKTKIREVTENKKAFLDLLLLADEQEDMIDRYLKRGRMFVLEDESGKVFGECVVTDEGGGVLEIKNIATSPEVHGMGYGKALIQYVENAFSGKFSVLQVGTGDSPLTVPFYKKYGFTRHHVEKDFFTKNYDHLIFEAGVQLVDMVYLRKKI